MNTDKNRLYLLLFIATAIAAYFIFDLSSILTLTNLKTQQNNLVAYSNNHPFSAVLAYFLVYIAITGLSLPGATLLTLAGGAVFGLLWGTLIVSFASSIGATLAFLAARFLFRETVRSRFSHQLSVVDKGVAQDGAYYLFTLRLVPLFPFFAINLLMGLTPIKATTFYWVSQLGMLAGTLAYVNAGTQLAKIDSISGILSPILVASFALLGLLPLLTQKLLALYEQSKRLQ